MGPIVASHYPHLLVQRTFVNSRLSKIQSDSATTLIADIIIPPAFSQCISAEENKHEQKYIDGGAKVLESAFICVAICHESGSRGRHTVNLD